MILLSWFLNLVEHSNFEVAYTLCEVVVDGGMILSDNSSCLLFDILFKISDVMTVLVSGSHVHHLFHVDPKILSNPVEHAAV